MLDLEKNLRKSLVEILEKLEGDVMENGETFKKKMKEI